MVRIRGMHKLYTLFGVLAATVCLWNSDWTTENIDCVFSNEQDDLLTKKNAKSLIFTSLGG